MSWYAPALYRACWRWRPLPEDAALRDGPDVLVVEVTLTAKQTL